MISISFVNPNKPKPIVAASAAPAPYTFGNPPKNSGAMNGHGDRYNEHWAKKKGCTPNEFALRDMAFQTAAKYLNFAINEVVYPSNWADFQKMGKCRVSKIFKTYADEDAVWPVKGAPRVVEVVAEGDNWSLYTATSTFFTRLIPIEPKVKV